MLSVLVLGVSACKLGKVKTDEVDPFAPPKPFEIAEVLTRREADEVRRSTVTKMNNVENLHAAQKVIEKDFVTENTSIVVYDFDLINYLNCGYGFNGKITEKYFKHSGIEYPEIEKRFIGDRFWQDDIMYFIRKTYDGAEETYFFKSNLVTPKDFTVVPSVLSGDILLIFKYADYYLTKSGTYQVHYDEELEYAISETYDGFKHSYTSIKGDLEINHNFELLNVFIEKNVRINYYRDNIERPVEELTLVESSTVVYNDLKYGTIKEIPNLAEKVSAFPACGFTEVANMNVSAYDILVDESNQIVVDTDNLKSSEDYEIDVKLAKDGSGKLSFLLNNFYFENNTAISLNLKCHPTKYRSGTTYYPKIESLDLSNGIGEEISDDFQVVEQDGEFFLVFNKNIEEPYSQPIYIYLDVSLTPALGEDDKPTGIITITNVEIKKFSYGYY
jgi:hypothetical protein